MNKFIKLLIICQVTLFFNACETPSEKNSLTGSLKNKKSTIKANIKYAKGFEIEYKDDFKVITLKDAWKGEKTTHQYILYKKRQPKGYENAIFIKTPITKIACMSGTHVALLTKLNQLNSIVAISGRNFANNPIIMKKVAKGEIKEIGNYQKINYEMLVEESPDIVMAFGIDQSSNTNIDKLKELGLDVVLNAEYMELHPLGKLEWIKFVAAFYDLGKEADTIFTTIETEYLELTELTKKMKVKPTVFEGMPWNGSWYVAGGKSFIAQFFKDAGATYLWGNNDEQGSYVKSKEIILDEAFDANYWLNLDSYSSLSAIVDCDDKFKNFAAFKNKKLFNNNKRLNVNGGNDYWESGVVNPHIVLKDLIEIFHPKLLEHELYYYQQLN